MQNEEPFVGRGPSILDVCKKKMNIFDLTPPFMEILRRLQFNRSLLLGLRLFFTLLQTGVTGFLAPALLHTLFCIPYFF